MALHYISNLDIDARGGGYSLRNTAAFAALRDAFGARYFGPVSPPALRGQKLVSALQRRLGGRGSFHFFAPRRLEKIREQVTAIGALTGDALFFNGFTPWVGITPEKPYIAWNDCSFHDYIRIYHDVHKFSPKDIARIEAQEARWLQGARAVILRSQHFADCTVAQYGLDSAKVFSLCNFSTLVPPEADTYAGAPLFLFMSTHFQGKNGPIVVKAFHKVLKHVPGARLAVAGNMPPESERSSAVEWVGYLDPTDPAQDRRKRSLLSEAACLVHPTNFDTNPAVLVEAAYFGCPAISTDAFAIPEIVQHGETGHLVTNPNDVDAIAGHMLWMLEESDAYWAMRSAARARAISQMTLDRFKTDIVEIVSEHLPESRLSSPSSRLHEA